MKIVIRPNFIILMAVFLVLLAIYVISPSIRIPQIQAFSLIFSIVASLVGIYTSRIYGFKSTIGRSFILITGGLICWSVAEIIWYVSDKLIEGGATSPSMADIFFLLAYPFFGAGIYYGFTMAKIKLKQVNQSLLVIVLTASLILTYLVVYFILFKAYDSTAEPIANIVNIGYGLGDLVMIILSLMTILVAREYKGGKLASFWKAIALGFLLVLIADIVYAIYGQQFLDDMKPYTYIDLLWIAGYLLPVYGMLENYLHVSGVQKKIKLKLQQRG